jgi:hypothetical protein
MLNAIKVVAWMEGGDLGETEKNWFCRHLEKS